MKNSIILFSILISNLTFGIDTISLKSIMSLKLGDKIEKLPKTYESDLFSYDLNLKKEKLIALSIYFNSLIKSSNHIKSSEQGYCLTQMSGGDIVIARHFFFNQELTKRYEVVPGLKIKSIVLQDMSQASKHPKCTFKEVIKKTTVGIK